MSGWEGCDWSWEKVAAAQGQQDWSLVQRQPELEMSLLAREVGNRAANDPRSTIAERVLIPARDKGEIESVRLSQEMAKFIPYPERGCRHTLPGVLLIAGRRSSTYYMHAAQEDDVAPYSNFTGKLEPVQ